MEWERARSEEQKEVRISEIIAATERLYKKYSFKEITFVLIAEEASFTRSNLYKYFSSKEEIFLEFLKQDIVLWRKDIIKTFKKKKRYSAEEFVSVWVEILNRHNRMLDLLSILFHFLEKNSSLQSVTEFKKATKHELIILTELLCGIFPNLTSEKAVEFVYLHISMAIGLYQMTNYNEVQLKAMENPELKDMKVEFNTYFEDGVLFLFKGLLD